MALKQAIACCSGSYVTALQIIFMQQAVTTLVSNHIAMFIV